MAREDVRFASAREKCAAWLFRPAETDDKVPCVILASGLSCVRDQRLDAFAERFAAAGFVALAFDYRCFGGSGGEPRQLFHAGRQRADWRAAIAYARTLDGVDANRIALWGFSAGGGHVQSLAISEPGISAAICVAPLVDGVRTLHYIGGLSLMVRLGLAGVRDGTRALRGKAPYRVAATGPPGSLAVLSSPESVSGFESVTPAGSTWRNDLCARSVLAPPYRLQRKARRISCPVLYCVTEGDDIIPPALAARAAERAPRGELRRCPGGHFDPFLGETFERMSADQVEFLRRNLLAEGD